MSNPVCEWCNQEFERPSKHGTVPRFCKPSHRQRAFEFSARGWVPPRKLIPEIDKAANKRGISVDAFITKAVRRVLDGEK